MFAFLLFISSCSIVKYATPTYEVINVNKGKDGCGLTLLDDKGEEFTTTLSVIQGNYVPLKLGDRIKFDMIEQNKNHITCENVQVLGD